MTTLNDEIDGIRDGNISLREAILCRPKRIDFAVEGVIPLRWGEIDLAHSVEIVGPGYQKLTLDGQSKARILRIEDDDPDAFSTVSISGLRFTNGTPLRQWSGDGGREVRFEEQGGGAIYSKEHLLITDCVFDGNGHDTAWGGGAICAGFGGEVRISRTTFSNNVADEDGAIWLEYASNALLESCTFDSNRANFASALDCCGEIEVHDSTFTNNVSDIAGTFRCRGQRVLLSHCTFVGNQATDGVLAFQVEKSNKTADPTTSRFEIKHCMFAENVIDSGKLLLLDDVEDQNIIPEMSHSVYDQPNLQEDIRDLGNNKFGINPSLNREP